MDSDQYLTFSPTLLHPIELRVSFRWKRDSERLHHILIHLIRHNKLIVRNYISMFIRNKRGAILNIDRSTQSLERFVGIFSALGMFICNRELNSEFPRLFNKLIEIRKTTINDLE